MQLLFEVAVRDGLLVVTSYKGRVYLPAIPVASLKARRRQSMMGEMLWRVDVRLGGRCCLGYALKVCVVRAH